MGAVEHAASRPLAKLIAGGAAAGDIRGGWEVEPLRSRSRVQIVFAVLLSSFAMPARSCRPPVVRDSTPRAQIVVRKSRYPDPEGSGTLGLLYVSGSLVDFVDSTFGVHFVGKDSIVFLPEWDGEFADHVLLFAGSRKNLAGFLPYFDSYFSSPVVTGSCIHYWGLRKQADERYQLYAMRFDFAKARMDSISLTIDDVRTDYRYYLGTPLVRKRSVLFQSQTTEFVVNTEYTRLISVRRKP